MITKYDFNTGRVARLIMTAIGVGDTRIVRVLEQIAGTPCTQIQFGSEGLAATKTANRCALQKSATRRD